MLLISREFTEQNMPFLVQGGKRATASDSEAGRLENLVMQRAAEVGFAL